MNDVFELWFKVAKEVLIKDKQPAGFYEYDWEYVPVGSEWEKWAKGWGDFQRHKVDQRHQKCAYKEEEEAGS